VLRNSLTLDSGGRFAVLEDGTLPLNIEEAMVDAMLAAVQWHIAVGKACDTYTLEPMVAVAEKNREVWKVLFVDFAS
jgi:hypothetical protein